MLLAVDFEQRYRAVATRDSRFDGAFVLGVRTTGIYCRPSCPARTPLPANVEFFSTGAAAQSRGFRACKRCLPDAVPGSPEWNLRSDVAARAMRLVADGVVEREGVGGLARRLGYTSRHLNRVLLAELGAGPLALARAHRAQTARQLLVGTDLSMADIAFASGFGSIRQFNDTIVEVYDRTPSQVRAARHPNAVEAEPAARISLALPVRQPFDASGVFAWLAVRAVPGVEDAGPSHYARTIALPRGPAVFEVRYDQQLRLTAELSALADLTPLVSRVRRLFDADADPVGIDAVLSREPALAESVRRTPGVRLPGAVDPHETLLRTMIGQQISIAAARTQLRRLVEACGPELPLPPADGAYPERWLRLTKPQASTALGRLFPTAAQVAAHGRDVLVGPKARIESILGVAQRLTSGELDLDWADDPSDQHRRLVAERGVGEWTASYVAMRVLGHPDVLPTGDVALRTGAARLGLPDRPAELAAWGARVSPWRSYAALHLWAASARKDIS
ncbi:MAG TPA: Ada metal-binding domain-containing protein [Propionicimonas sp.]|mgnify:FL=1|nr:Ada metal-binding domain-containing protein [Propionicimonas sp.]